MLRFDGVYVRDEGDTIYCVRFFDDLIVFLTIVRTSVYNAAHFMQRDREHQVQCGYTLAGSALSFAYQGFDKKQRSGSGQVSADGLSVSIAITRAGKRPGPVEVYGFHPIPERVLAGHWGKEEEADLLRARIASGEVARERVVAAAACGHTAAGLAVGIRFEENEEMEPVGKVLAPLGGEACARALLALYWNRDFDHLCLSQEGMVRAGPRTKPGQAVRALAKLLAEPSAINKNDAYGKIDALDGEGHEELRGVIEVRDLATTEERERFMADALANYAAGAAKSAYQQLSHTIGPWLLDGVDPYK